MCTADGCLFNGDECVHECPLSRGEVCDPKSVRERAILYIIQAGHSLTLREITSIMFYVDLKFEQAGYAPFFSQKWEARDTSGVLTFIPSNLTSIFPARKLSTINVKHDKNRTSYTTSGEIVYEFDTSKVSGECDRIATCKDFLKCVVEDFFVEVHVALSIIKSRGLEGMVEEILRLISLHNSTPRGTVPITIGLPAMVKAVLGAITARL